MEKFRDRSVKAEELDSTSQGVRVLLNGDAFHALQRVFGTETSASVVFETHCAVGRECRVVSVTCRLAVEKLQSSYVVTLSGPLSLLARKKKGSAFVPRAQEDPAPVLGRDLV